MSELLDNLLSKAAQRIGRRSLPEATYRLQFHAGFKFQDAQALVPYLRELGISHVYASPFLQARPGSMHGYDITDHRALNPEIGSDADFDALVKELRLHGMGQILDMVPNHMGIFGNRNPWWNDVLENGPASPYAGYFDIAWQDSLRPELKNRILLPVLGEPYGKALESGQIRLAYDFGAFFVHYFDHCLPVTPRSYATILSHDLADLQKTLGTEAPAWTELQSILTAVSHLPRHDEKDPARIAELLREKEVVKRRLAALTRESSEVRQAIARTVEFCNGRVEDRHSFDFLDQLLDQQAYRLSFWRVASDEINYRRFFDINELAALNMEKMEVFLATHEFVLRLLSLGKVDGLRIDHPDGLFDPKQYLTRLQQHYLLAQAHAVFEADASLRDTDWKKLEGPLLERIRATPVAPDLYVVVEKILGTTEELPDEWPTHGTSGYDFLNAVNGLFVDPAGEEALTRFYQSTTGSIMALRELVYRMKSLIMRDTLSSELSMLAQQLDRLAQKNRRSRDFTGNSLRFALREVIAFFAVYRSYISDEGVHDTDRRNVELAVARAMHQNPTVSGALFRFVRDMLLLDYPDTADADDQAEQRRFAGKFQQVTAPVMAKGLEDTAFYIYNRLVSLNEVGGDPGRFGTSPDDVHQYMQTRRARWPHALSTLSTHDTKRSEDVRARINVLSEMPQEWQERVTRWRRWNEKHRTIVDDAPAPDADEEYLIYQTLIGAWPLEPGNLAEFIERIQAYLQKALSEAKVHTSWINPNDAYLHAVHQFVERILDEKGSREFVDDLRAFQQRISHFGMFNSLAQTLLKITCPGVPDTYQGMEMWDLSLVDPDNRRPVDYVKRTLALQELDGLIAAAGADQRTLVRQLMQTREDGRVKLFVTSQALRCRRRRPALFSIGDYLPATLTGQRAGHVFGFARRHENDFAVVAVPRFASQIVDRSTAMPLGQTVWQDTRLALPFCERKLKWQNVFTGQEVRCAVEREQTIFSMAELLADFPIALIVNRL